MTNYFTIYFSDLMPIAQESIKKLVRQRIKDDAEKMKELTQLAEEKSKEYAPGIDLDNFLDPIIEEEVDDIINREYSGKGEV